MGQASACLYSVRGLELPTAASDAGTGARTACGVKSMDGTPPMPHPVNQDHIQGMSGTWRACYRLLAWPGRHHPQWGTTDYETVPQGKRGLLWDRPGQFRHLPPPSVSFTGVLCQGRACVLPVPGVSSRAVLPLDNTARPYSQHTQHQSASIPDPSSIAMWNQKQRRYGRCFGTIWNEVRKCVFQSAKSRSIQGGGS